MDPAGLDTARRFAFDPMHHTQGVVVVRHGEIVGEWYADGADETSWAASWSVAKSFTSALVGIAIDEGKIPSVDEPMTTYFPAWKGTPRETMTIRDVLEMKSGLDWDEGYEGSDVSESEVAQMVLNQSDQLAYAASIASEVEPGTRWSYSSGDAMLLSGVLQQATGMRAEAYADEKLFGPIGMEQVEWWQDAEGHTLTYCCLDTTTRDFARFGLLYLHQGAWGDRQVVPQEWVAESLRPAADTGDQYGYQWWLTDIAGIPEETFTARGHDGQFIYVVPSLDLVVVRNGAYVKDPGDPVADPNLFGKYPTGGLIAGKGTTPPEQGWDHAAFLGPIVDAVADR
jgi:CubicO group peptidase (beta-lactamase class C family)